MKHRALLLSAACVALAASPAFAEDHAPAEHIQEHLQEQVQEHAPAETMQEGREAAAQVVPMEEGHETAAKHAEPQEQPALEEQVQWGYEGAGAAAHWGGLDAAYEVCKSGLKQSPVNIEKYSQVDLPQLEISYNAVPLEVMNNGHTVQVNYAQGSSMSVGGKTFELLQFHFHTPSEHYLDGAPYPMEVHFVHKAEDGTLGVLSVMMKVGEHNPVIEGIWQNVPMAGKTKDVVMVQVNAFDLLPEDLGYYQYEGSLTTPPCTEGVQWHVMKTPIEVSAEQVTAFQGLFPVNARPVQDLHGRVVKGE